MYQPLSRRDRGDVADLAALLSRNALNVRHIDHLGAPVAACSRWGAFGTA